MSQHVHTHTHTQPTKSCVCIWTDSCLITTFHISATDEASVLSALHRSSLLSVSFFLTVFQALSDFLQTAACSDSVMMLQGIKIDCNAGSLTSCFRPLQSKNGRRTAQTFLYQKSKGFLSLFFWCQYCYWLLLLLLFSLGYLPLHLALLLFHGSVSCCFLMLCYIILDDVEPPQTPFPVLNLQAPKPETFFSCL